MNFIYKQLNNDNVKNLSMEQYEIDQKDIIYRKYYNKNILKIGYDCEPAATQYPLIIITEDINKNEQINKVWLTSETTYEVGDTNEDLSYNIVAVAIPKSIWVSTDGNSSFKRAPKFRLDMYIKA